jgi:hypothetical protein
MIRLIILFIASLIFSTFSAEAASVPKGFHDLESKPIITISKNKGGFASYSVESVKYHLYHLFIESNEYLSPYLIKEKYKTKITEGMEGSLSTIILELWELDVDRVQKRIWKISQDADRWHFSDNAELVLSKYGCCGEQNVYYFYDIRKGSLLRIERANKLPTNKIKHDKNKNANQALHGIGMKRPTHPHEL